MFVSATNRKRSPSSPPLPPGPASPSKPRFPKRTKLNYLFDGTGSRSLDSTSTGKSKPSVKSQLKKQISNFKSILGVDGRGSGASVQRYEDNLYSITQGSESAYILANGSNTTTLHQPLKLRLAAIPDATEGNQDANLVSTLISRAPFTPGLHTRLDDDDYISSNATDISKRSQSAPGLQRRLSQKFQWTLGNGNSTVVKRGSRRSRPSVQTLAQESAAATSAQLSSTPSTFNSGSFWGTHTNTSTPLTSAQMTPQSVVRRGSMDSFDIERHTFKMESRLLAPIPEFNSLPTLTIMTVEAAATAKMYLELHFNSIFTRDSTRNFRRRELESRMRHYRLHPGNQDRTRKAWEKAESENLRQHRVLKNTTNQKQASKGISPGGFEVISILGKGSFGVVRLVRFQGLTDEGRGSTTKDAHTPRISRADFKSPARMLSSPFFGRRKSRIQPKHNVYAMKVIRKSDMIRNGQEGHLRAERDFLVAAEGSRWIIPLIASFQDQKHLYLVMEYCIGGDFLGLLIRKNILSEEVTKWYIAEMILCVEEAHRMGWIHRDVKPDNFLVGFDGHLKISDFGLAFDGEWSHDQRFYHKNRQLLLDELAITVEGDEQDRQEKQSQAHHADKRHGKDESNSIEDPSIGEPILDFRNRTQRRRLARSVVGTSQYMAPEVIRGELYDGRCD